MALISLEAISDEVHTQRRLRRQRLELPLRTPGVGAEQDLDDELSDMPSASLGPCCAAWWLDSASVGSTIDEVQWVVCPGSATSTPYGFITVGGIMRRTSACKAYLFWLRFSFILE